MTVTCEVLETNLREKPGHSLAFVGEDGETVCVVGQFDVPQSVLCALRDSINAAGLDALHIHDIVEDALMMWRDTQAAHRHHAEIAA